MKSWCVFEKKKLSKGQSLCTCRDKKKKKMNTKEQRQAARKKEGKVFVHRCLEHTSNRDKIIKKRRLSPSKKATEITPAQHDSEHREEKKKKLCVKFGYLIIESEESQWLRVLENNVQLCLSAGMKSGLRGGGVFAGSSHERSNRQR